MPTIRRQTPTSMAKRLVAVLAVATLGVTGQLAPPLTPQAHAAPGDLTWPLAVGEQPTWLDGATGDTAVVWFAQSDQEMLTRDRGATWTPAAVEAKPVFVGNDKMAVWDAATRTVSVYPLAGGSPTTRAIPAGTAYARTTDTHVLVLEGKPMSNDPAVVSAVTMATGAVVPLGTSAGGNYHQLGSSVALWGESAASGPGVWWRVAPLSGAPSFFIDEAGTEVVERPILVEDTVMWAAKTSRGDLALCRFPLATRTTTCTPVATGMTLQNVQMGGTATATLLTGEASGMRRAWLVEDGRVVQVRTPGGARVYPAPGSLGSRPLVSTVDGYSVVHVVAPDGTLSRAYSGPTGPLLPVCVRCVPAFGVSLTPDRVLYLDRRAGVAPSSLSQWVRSITALGVGAEVALAPRVPALFNPVGISAGRGVATDEAQRALLYDRGVLTQTITAGIAVTDISGPYYLAFNPRDVRGREYPSPASALFGSLTAEAKQFRAGEPYEVQVADLSRAGQVVFRAPLPADVTYANVVGLYGDWVAVNEHRATGRSLTVINTQTGRRISRPSVQGQETLGDGWITYDNGIWRFADDTVDTAITGGKDALGSDRINRVAFADGASMVLRTVPGVGTSPARFLGLMAAESFDPSGEPWRPEIDASKPLKAGTLLLKDRNGAIVRRIATPASADGSIRGLAWDGRDATGRVLGQGAYVWEFVADGADGTGTIRDVRGKGTPSGLVVIGQRFSDVSATTQFFSEIEWLATQGITTGFIDGTYHPVAPVNRDAMAAFLYRYAGSPAFTAPARSPFSDIGPGAQFYKEVTWLASRKITTGWADGTFRPTDPISRDAMAAFLYRFAGSPTFTPPKSSPFSDVSPTTDFYREITWLASTGVATGYPEGSYRPITPVGRDAMAAFLHRVHRDVKPAR